MQKSACLWDQYSVSGDKIDSQAFVTGIGQMRVTFCLYAQGDPHCLSRACCPPQEAWLLIWQRR